jgi:TonB-dependent receptor
MFFKPGLLFSVLCFITHSAFVLGQTDHGSVLGRVTDSSGAIVSGAQVQLAPTGTVARTDQQGSFTIPDVIPGDYTVTVGSLGFSLFSSRIAVRSGRPVRVDAVLQPGTHNETVTVHADREGGEMEALDIERTADNIVQVLPADVINSLPNTNIADAVGRLPSVSLERDEGEGKYIQIRGTEPRLSNVTIDGIHVPSPEGIRNVKLDVIPADLVESVEVNKTLSANQDADAIGGSVNLVTKTAADLPTVSLLGMGGYTPITGGRDQYQFAGTVGQRFGAQKKIGALFGFSYDYNARGIDDVEPGQAVNALPNGGTFLGPNTEDIRLYHYDRTRYGFDGEVDYKLKEMSSIYLRGLFSHFNDYGEDWIYSPGISNFITSSSDPNNTCGITSTSGIQGCGGISMTNVYRRPEQQIVSAQAGARHLLGSTVLTYEVALSQANYTGGYPRASFGGPGSSDNSVAFGVDTSNPFTPKFPVLNGINIYDPTQYTLNDLRLANESTFERDVVGDIDLNKQYKLGSHASSFEMGFKGWDARKTQLYDDQEFSPSGPIMDQFLSSFHDSSYYFNQYKYGPVTRFNSILAQYRTDSSAFPGAFTTASGQVVSTDYIGNLSSDFDLSERIWAGYAMDTISFGNFRLQGGIRVESTDDILRANNITLDSNANFASSSPLEGGNSYINVFPSVQAQYRFGSDTVLRAAYGMGIARPNFGDTAPFLVYDPTNPNVPVTAGNPKLQPTHAQNFDLLAEHYMKRAGLIQGGFFYKYLTNPIYYVNTTIPAGQPYAGLTQNAPVNGPNGYIAGFEASWQQQLSFMPGALNGMGVRANYGYTTSRATFPVDASRVDHPTLLRTAPNNWNFDVTYDKKAVSARMGLTHNDAYIWSYGGSNAPDPSGDTYLYPHTQVDAQVSFWIPRGHGLQALISGLNLNNEVFGFYNGSERYPIQREYYGRTISAGLRWTLQRER